MAFLGNKTLADPVMNPVERVIALGGVRAKQDMTGWGMLRCILYLNLHLVYLLIMFRIITVESDWVGCAYLALRVAHDDHF